MQEHNRASAWFNELYEEHKEKHENIPWARGSVNPLLESYLSDKTETHKGKALVIGCGLGDDAHALELAKEHFDFVFEALTIQSLPIEFRKKMINTIADTLALNARLLLVAHKREDDFKGPPF